MFCRRWSFFFRKSMNFSLLKF